MLAHMQHEDGMCQFSPTRATNPLSKQRSLSAPSEAIRIFYYEADLPLCISCKFGKDQSRHYDRNIGSVRIFGHMCTHPPMQMSHKISGVTEPKFTKFLLDVKESSRMLTQKSALRYSHPL